MVQRIEARVAQPFVFVIAGGIVLGVVALMALLYESTTFECTRARGDEGTCVLVQRRLTGKTERRLPASSIRNASISVSTSRGSNPAPTGTHFVLDLADGPPIIVDEVAFAFLDPSFDRNDTQAIDRFLADKTIEHTYAKNGCVASMLAIIIGLGVLAGSLAWMWGFARIEIVVDGGALTVTGEDVSRHRLEGITNVVVDAAYHSLRVHYRDGTSQRTARLGVAVARLEEFAQRTRALLTLTEDPR
ncbi:MAG TPA: hypothetical protein VH054_03310 [Polyangiaceae bacterium]|nr:hypothetical protein [Polyangiaceae bacterium]